MTRIGGEKRDSSLPFRQGEHRFKNKNMSHSKSLFLAHYFSKPSNCSTESEENMPKGNVPLGSKRLEKKKPSRYASKKNFFLNVLPQDTTGDPKKGFTRPAIQRICRRAGVKRISGKLYPTAREILSEYTRSVVFVALATMESGSRKTLSTKDVKFALAYHGRTVYGGEV